ncbi:hypothetical protein [Actinoplanes sp. G11-F43]|uniref:hypothetical protein n=1 Tax=Actinoplanes sp. G11-F43 TaxID=3424130 RepID=UPI003D34001B
MNDNARLRPVLWVLLIVGLAANAVASITGNEFIGAGFGLVALAAGTGLAVHHYRYRRQ